MVSKTDLTDLVATRTDPAVSVYLPVHGAMPDRRKNAIRLRNLLREAEERLAARGNDPTPILAVAREAFDPEPPIETWDTMGVAIFITDDRVKLLKLARAPREAVAVGQGFAITPMLPFLDNGERFYVITLDQASPTLFRSDGHALTTVATDVMERSLHAIRGMTELPADVGLHSMALGGPGGSAQYRHAQGDSPEDYRQIELDQFAKSIAKALERHLKRESAPLVPVGEPNLLGMFRHHCHYAGLTRKGVAKSPRGLDADALFAETHAIAEPILAGPRREALDRVAGAHNRGDGPVSIDPGQIVSAAEEGRVGTLLLARDETGSRLKAASEGDEAKGELCDRIARATLRNGGDILAVGTNDLPGEATMAALFRY